MEVLAVVIFLCFTMAMLEFRDWKTKEFVKNAAAREAEFRAGLTLRLEKSEAVSKLNEEHLNELREYAYLVKAGIDDLIKAKDTKLGSYHPPSGEHYEEL